MRKQNHVMFWEGCSEMLVPPRSHIGFMAVIKSSNQHQDRGSCWLFIVPHQVAPRQGWSCGSWGERLFSPQEWSPQDRLQPGQVIVLRITRKIFLTPEWSLLFTCLLSKLQSLSQGFSILPIKHLCISEFPYPSHGLQLAVFVAHFSFPDRICILASEFLKTPFFHLCNSFPPSLSYKPPYYKSQLPIRRPHFLLQFLVAPSCSLSHLGVSMVLPLQGQAPASKGYLCSPSYLAYS